MTTIQASRAAHIAGAHAPKSFVPSADTLLPAPDQALAKLGDPMIALYALIGKNDADQMKSNENGVIGREKQQMAELKKEKDALKAAEDAKKDAGGFWSSVASVASVVAKVATAVAAAAAVVFSGGAAAPLILAIAAIALSAGGTLVTETKVFGDKASKWVGLGMELGAAVCTGGAGLMSAGAAAANTTTTTVAATAKYGATLTSAGATAVGGVAHMEVAKYESRAADFEADGAAAMAKAQQQKQQMEELLDWMKTVHESHGQAQQTIEKTLQTKQATMASLSTLGGSRV